MNILAIFAHPDDELGCIGTLCKHALRGDNVKLIWTTYGELASHYVTQEKDEVKAVREQHGTWVAEQVGGSYEFLDIQDSYVRGSREEALALARIYSTFAPDVIITWSDDHPHPDHRMSAKAAFDAITLARIPKILNEGWPEAQGVFEPHRKPVSFYQYPPTGTSLFPLVHVDISEVIEVTERVFRFYKEFYNWDFSPEEYRMIRRMRGREVGVMYAERFQLRKAHYPVLNYLL